jgi:DNA-binding response OmpR family regulator
MSRILVIEDEPSMRTALADLVSHEGHRVMTTSNGESGLEVALREQPDLILLDVMLPHLDGFEIASELRRLNRNVPILMLTAKGQVQDRVRGLDSGADDYLVKPFSTDELLARVRSLLRRGNRGQRIIPDQLDLGGILIDFSRFEARKGAKAIHLTAKEFGMLRLMLASPGQPVARERFLDVVWGVGAFPTTRTVDNHIASLRTKLEPDPDHPRYLVTVHGVGYKLELLTQGS